MKLSNHNRNYSNNAVACPRQTKDVNVCFVGVIDVNEEITENKHETDPSRKKSYHSYHSDKRVVFSVGAHEIIGSQCDESSKCDHHNE